jgi:septal ring factor EnvC (AmiA/AmiB activator)|tara:strand:+ start:3870 stop:4253 length:384 start_codon:yes stop_codon:yes gene_type:complete
MGLKGMLIMGVLMAAMAGGFYFYYKDTQNRIQVLTKNNAKLETAVQTQQTAIDTLQQDAERFDKENRRLQIRLDDAEKEKDALHKKLQRHNLTRDALRKPGLIEKIINRATKREYKSIEDLTKRPTR